MTLTLKDYEASAGYQAIEELYMLAEKTKGLSVQNINSTAVGGGVAEILNRMIPFFKELGVDARWDVIKGGEDFYRVTKMMHNALHGHAESFTLRDFKCYQEYTDRNLSEMDLEADMLLIHDPQPAGL